LVTVFHHSSSFLRFEDLSTRWFSVQRRIVSGKTCL